MRRWFRRLDEILRGEATQLSTLKSGTFDVPVVGMTTVLLILGVFTGLCVGSWALVRSAGRAWEQFAASGVKLPLLFLLTLAITFPSLYVFNALMGSRLKIGSALKLLLATLAVMLAVHASLGPIIFFFGTSTTSYPFMVLLNVIVGAIAGILGLTFLLRTLHRLIMVQQMEAFVPLPAAPPRKTGAKAEADPEPDTTAAPDESLGLKSARSVFRVWVIVFALVGAQMSWVLRPLIGNPSAPFTIFRAREGNFFLAVAQALGNLFR